MRGRETWVSDSTQNKGEEKTKNNRHVQKRQSRVVGDMMTSFETQNHGQSRVEMCLCRLLGQHSQNRRIHINNKSDLAKGLYSKCIFFSLLRSKLQWCPQLQCNKLF